MSTRMVPRWAAAFTLLATLATLSGLAGAGPAAAAGGGALGVSADGTSWSGDLAEPLFDPALRWVPGERQKTSFFVRNQTADRGRLSVRVDARDPQSLLRDPDLTLAARVGGGPWTVLPDDGAFHQLGAALGAGDAARVEVDASFDSASTNSSQRKTLDLQLRALLTQDTAPAPRPPLPPRLAHTGASVVEFGAFALLLIALGRVLLASRHRTEQPHE